MAKKVEYTHTVISNNKVIKGKQYIIVGQEKNDIVVLVGYKP